jgi:hypothetical protein
MKSSNKGHSSAASSAKPKTAGMQHGGTGGKDTTGKNNGKSYK